MAKDRLIVKNFGPIKNVDIELRKVTVFIGEQASGKSVLAKLATLLSNPVASESNGRLLGDMIPWLYEFNIHNFLDNDSFASFENDQLTFGFKKSHGFKTFKDATVSGYFSKLEGVLKETAKEEADFVSKPFSERQAKEYFENREKFLMQINFITALLRRFFSETIYIPTERNLVSILSKSLFNILKNDVDLMPFVTAFGSKYESARKVLSPFEVPALKLKYSFSENTDKITLENSKQIDLVESSSGVQSIIPIAVVVNATPKEGKHLFIVEEPELNLYPTTQKALVEYLIEKCTQGDNSLIITTHSPYILTALNNCIQAQNVIDKHPESVKEVNEIISPQFHLKYEDVIAYHVAEGTAKPIMDDETQMIDANELDSVSDDLATVFDKLLDLKYQEQE